MTTQIPDRLRFNRRVHKLFTEPLESYFDDQHPKPKPKALACSCTSCWRGYVAGWCIKRGKLYLEKLEPFFDNSPFTEKLIFSLDAVTGRNEPIMPPKPNYLAQVFPGAAAPVFAEWFSGDLRYLPLKFYWGKCVSECEALEAACVMHVENGSIITGNPDSSIYKACSPKWN
jgi:hypothetical protein